MKDVIYRQATKQDCPHLGGFISQADGGVLEFLLGDLVPGMTPAQMVAYEMAQDKDHRSFRNVTVAQADGDTVGMAFCYPSEFHAITEDAREFIPLGSSGTFGRLYEARVEQSLYLDALSVDQAFRGRGIGGKLLEMVEDKAVSLGLKSISLIVFADNAAAQKLYKRHGFEIVKKVPIRRHPHIPHDGGCFLMENKLPHSGLGNIGGNR